MMFLEVYLVVGLAALGLMDLPPLTGPAQKNVTIADPCFSRMKTAS